MASSTRRPVMVLYSQDDCIDCHRVRIILAEKGIVVDIQSVDSDNLPEELLELNPYGTVPTLVDRELVLYDAHVIMEYLDERFPHPPLMAVDPVQRAQTRMLLSRVRQEWYGYVYDIINDIKIDEARQNLHDSLLAVNSVFAHKTWFTHDEFTLVDCSIAALLWRLPVFGVELPESAAAINAYSERAFSRESFKTSLTAVEYEMRYPEDLD
jgi:stringent starvation protein A